jgi:hypothetical protein
VVSCVRLQTLFRENPQYFMVTVAEVDLRRPPEQRPNAAVAVSRAGGRGVRVARPTVRPGALHHGPRPQARLQGHAVAAADTVPRPHLSRRPRRGGEAGLVLVCSRVDGVLWAGVQGLDGGAFTAAVRGR